MESSRRRREEFKLSWGVSPRSVNLKRTVKTMVVCPPRVNITEEAAEEAAASVEAKEEEEDGGGKEEEIQRIVEELQAAETELEAGRQQQQAEQEQQEVEELQEREQQLLEGSREQEGGGGQQEGPFLSSGSLSPSLGGLVDAAVVVGAKDEAGPPTPGDLSLVASLESRNLEWFGDLFGADDALDLGGVSEVAVAVGGGRGGEVKGEEEEKEEDLGEDDEEEVEMDITQVSVNNYNGGHPWWHNNRHMTDRGWQSGLWEGAAGRATAAAGRRQQQRQLQQQQQQQQQQQEEEAEVGGQVRRAGVDLSHVFCHACCAGGGGEQGQGVNGNTRPVTSLAW